MKNEKKKNELKSGLFYQKSIISVILMLLIVSMMACGNSEMSDETLEEGLYPMPKNGNVEDKWGYIDETGEFVIEAQYKYVDRFYEGLAAVQDCETGLWGYIDGSGEYVIAPQFYEVGSFSNGYAVVTEKYIDENGWMTYRSGYISSNGEIVIIPQYAAAYNFDSNGLAIVAKGNAYENSSLEYMRINKSGNQVETITESDVPFETWDFSQGPLLYKDEATGKYGYVNEDREFVIEPDEKYSEFSFFFSGMAVIAEECSDSEISGYIYGFVDEEGELCTEMKYSVQYGFVNNACLVETLPDEDGIVSYGYIDKKGKWIIKKEYDKNFVSD